MKCRDKVTYLSKETAEHAFRYMRKRIQRRGGRSSMHGVRVYKCHICNHYHLGHRPSLENLEMIRLHSNPSVLEWKEFIMNEILQRGHHLDAGYILTNQRRIA